jgi:hypothetical protein
MRELMFSMMRLSCTVTIFGMEQAQNVMLAPADTRAALVRLCNTLDSMADALASKLDDPKMAALESMSKSQMDMINRTRSAANLDAVSMDTAADFMKKTSESLANIMNGAPKGKAVNGRAA